MKVENTKKPLLLIITGNVAVNHFAFMILVPIFIRDGFAKSKLNKDIEYKSRDVTVLIRSQGMMSHEQLGKKNSNPY